MEVSMRVTRSRFLGVVVAFVLSSRGVAQAQSPDVVLEWNRLLLAAIGTPGAINPTIFFTRYLAVMNVAVFEALNSFERTYTPYVDWVTVPPGASRDAAVAQAAHDALSTMFPTEVAVFDATLAAQLSRLPSTAAQDGARVGAAAARAVIERRRTDGWNRPPVVYLLPSLAGFWQPVPPANAPAAYTHYPDVEPFVIGSARQFLVEPPPSLTSQRYADDFNEAKAIGGVNSTTRTADQTLVARLFAPVATVTTTSIPAVWSNLTRDLVRARNLTDVEAARLFALMTTTFHDAVYASMSGKYLYGFWRPVTAIRDAARDGNPATEPDPEFNSLIPTPPYPSYPGNYACLASAITRVFTRYFGRDDVAFSITWTAPSGPNITRSYNGFRQLSDEAAKSRIYGGIHFEFDTTSSYGVCVPLGDYVFENAFRR
jgi:hypothetical protein